jgi:hypothetical protein
MRMCSARRPGVEYKFETSVDDFAGHMTALVQLYTIPWTYGVDRGEVARK